MTGKLHVKNKMFYAVLYVKQGNPKQKWINTGFSERGNKKAANAILSAIIEQHGVKESFNGIDFSQFKQGIWKDVAEFEQQDSSVQFVIAEKVAEVTTIPQIVPKQLLSEYVWEFMTSKKEEKSRPYSPATWKGYKDIVKHIQGFFDRKPCYIETVNAQDIKDYITYCRDECKISETTIKRKLEVLKPAILAATRRGVRNGLSEKDRNPFEYVQPVVVNKPKISFYNKENLARLLEVIANHESKLEFELAGFYGLRRSELLGINYKDGIDFDAHRVNLKYSVLFQDGALIIKEVLKNTASEAAMPLTAEIEKKIRQRINWIEQNKKIYRKSYCKDYDGFLCVDTLGQLKKPDTLSHQLKHIIEKHNLPHITMHGLRHTCASILLAENKNLKEIQEWLRHSDITTTLNMYAHLDAAKKQECADSMSGVFGFMPEDKTVNAIETLKNLLADNPDLLRLLTEQEHKKSEAEM